MKRMVAILATSLLVVGLSGATRAEGDEMADAVTTSDNPVVVVKTSMGTIEIELFQDKAPISVENFLGYVDDGFYNGTIFHRVMKGFMIQGGGFDQGMERKKAKAPIKNEATNGVGNEIGTVAMARTDVVDSATSQFFINTVNNARLDYKSARSYGYAVFGKVISGMEVAKEIESVQTATKNGMGDVPVTTVTIESITRK